MIDENQKNPGSKKTENESQEKKEWDNPINPEGAKDERDIEKLSRQKKEAERRKDNLTTDNTNDK